MNQEEMILITELIASRILSSFKCPATERIRKRDNNYITFYKSTHASSSSGVSQSLEREVSLNSMVSGIK
jgi:hypothetical protein